MGENRKQKQKREGNELLKVLKLGMGFVGFTTIRMSY